MPPLTRADARRINKALNQVLWSLIDDGIIKPITPTFFELTEKGMQMMLNDPEQRAKLEDMVKPEPTPDGCPCICHTFSTALLQIPFCHRCKPRHPDAPLV